MVASRCPYRLALAASISWMAERRGLLYFSSPRPISVVKIMDGRQEDYSALLLVIAAQPRCARWPAGPRVIFRKVTNCFRSQWGANLYADILSTIETARRRAIAALEAIRLTLNGTPLPVPATHLSR
jgi:hypothetical protein